MGSKRFRNCEKMQESCEKIARKLREMLLAKCRGTPQKLNKIKGYRKISTIKTRSFQDRLVVTASIFLHINATHRAAVICREYLHGSEKFIFQNPLRIPHEVIGVAKRRESVRKQLRVVFPRAWPNRSETLLTSDECGYSRPWRDIPLQPFWIVNYY